jgi:hypothetical protein
MPVVLEASTMPTAAQAFGTVKKCAATTTVAACSATIRTATAAQPRLSEQRCGVFPDAQRRITATGRGANQRRNNQSARIVGNCHFFGVRAA